MTQEQIEKKASIECVKGTAGYFAYELGATWMQSEMQKEHEEFVAKVNEHLVLLSSYILMIDTKDDIPPAEIFNFNAKWYVIERKIKESLTQLKQLLNSK